MTRARGTLGVTALCLLPILVAAAGTGGCARARAQTQPQMPVLEAPPPPPRVFATPESDPPPSPPVTAPEEEAPAARPPQRPASPRTETPRTAPPARAAEPQSQPEPARADESRPTRTLQTPEPTERAIRDQLARASGGLMRVDYRGLTTSLKEQYDIAKRFIQQADEALKARNLVYAATLAAKAVEIAEVLPRR